MARREKINTTGLPRIEGIPYHDAWISFCCINCFERNFVRIGKTLIAPDIAYDSAEWVCKHCNYTHSKEQNLPFQHWDAKFTDPESIAAQRFWQAFFRSACERPEVYWKQCNMCTRILPFFDFSRHKGWGPLEKQMECRACKAVINADLNPKRTKQQLHESSIKRRIADLLLEGEDEPIDIQELFLKFNSKCFKTGKLLDINDRATWEIDHIIPSKYLYPLTQDNAALLSREANQNKGDKWPSNFYTNSELKKLADIVGANLSLLARETPIINPNINVDLCVTRFLNVREGTSLNKRIEQLKQLLISRGLIDSLSDKNKKYLGL
ncbi:TPA: hypothetical protein JBD49_03765 [Legionella pneumophila subsp. pneumophila]|nr:hypothetical protein [Legionella pneumophila]HAT7877844.1 hypothetical protein [Legionella pneumophila]HAT9698948.1 hypothetical protein [Legionella pneumophila subsp. pneumophila]